MFNIKNLYLLDFFKLGKNFGLILLAIIVFFICIDLFYSIINYYPSKKIRVNITNLRKMDKNDAIDYYLTNYGKEIILEHIKTIEEWKNKKKEKVKEKNINKLENRWQKNKSRAFLFVFYRNKTRYKQVNYVRYPYTVEVVDNRFYTSDDFLVKRISFLEENDYYVTYNQSTKNDQRKAMTKELRYYIKKRDGYKCQICGKFMPDEVGLHIDHIIPVSKGGKSVPNNLRVLCSKCNGSKGSK